MHLRYKCALIFCVLLAAASLTLPLQGRASQQDPCLRDLLEMTARTPQKTRLARTLGTEWEFTPMRFAVNSEKMDPFMRSFAAAGAYERELANSKFRELFAFYAQDASGNWVKDLIPNSIVQTEGFKALQSVPSIHFETRNGKTYLTHAAELSSGDYILVLKQLMELRGKSGKNLKLRKIPAAWIGKTNPMDRLIPEVVAEEWNGASTFVGLEFPMNGATSRGSKLRNYLRHLWTRLELFQAGDPKLEAALDRAVGHVHWVPHAQKAPIEQRKKIYDSVIAYWGDANDSAEITQMNVFREHLGQDGNARFDAETAAGLWKSLSKSYGQISITTLTRDEYLRLSATKDGILVKHRSFDLEPHVDPNIPPTFKRHQFGLRGSYGQESLEDGKPIPTVGIEARNMPSQSANLAALPKKVKGQPEVDLSKLLRHATPEARGLVGSQQGIKELAQGTGVDPKLVDDLSQVLAQDGKGFRWSKEQILARMFLPLNPWKDHPLVQRNLASLSNTEHEAALTRFDTALENYKRRMNQLAQARRNPNDPYQPEWSTSLRSFPNGYNRVYPQTQFTEIAGPGETTSRPDTWFQIIIATEASRFIAESGLATLMKMP